MDKKLIHLISLIVLLCLVHPSYGAGIVIGNFEDDLDEWGKDDPSNPNITLTRDPTGATLDSNSLKIEDATGGGFERAVEYSLVANDNVEEFRSNRRIVLDLTRVYDGIDWGNYDLGWNEFHMIIEAGNDDPNNGEVWAEGWNMVQIANWGPWNDD